MRVGRRQSPTTIDDAGQDGSALSDIADAVLHPRPVWRSQRAYVLATIAGVVGLGNVWRFPYMVGQHGGGSFVVAYLVCVVAVAVPLAAIESAAGGLVRRSPVGAFRRAHRGLGGLVGWAVVAMTVAILSYYTVVTGWTLGYAADAVRGDVRVFSQFVTGYRSLWLLLAIGVAMILLLIRGVTAVEQASRILVPFLVIIVVGLAIYGQTLDGAAEARSFYLGVDLDHLGDPATWRAAAGQAFYSIGVGQGMLIAYGSYVPAGTNMVRSTLAVAITSSAVSVISGLMVFAVVFSFDLSPGVGSELSFTAFPRVFPEIPGGAILAVVFFCLLFLAGFSSCIGAALVVMSTLGDELGITRRRAAIVTVVGVVILGIPSALSFTDAGWTVGGRPILDQVDQATGAGAIVVLGLAGAALLATALPRRVLTAALGSGHSDGMRRQSIRFLIRWVQVLPIAAVGLVMFGLLT